MAEHGGLAHLSGTDDHDRFEGIIHTKELPLQFTMDIFHANHLVQSKVYIILAEFELGVNFSSLMGTLGPD